jgi:large subunit ribosomal protein L4
LLLVRGAVPGPAGSYILIRKAKAQVAVSEICKRARDDDDASCGRKNLEGKKVGQIDLADDVFGAKVNPHLLHEAVRHIWRASAPERTRRRTRAKFPARARNCGSRRARAARASVRFGRRLWRHGGTVHGPVPRSYDYALPKKMILGALRSALSAKVAEQKLTVVDGWSLETHKTKAFRACSVN